MLTQMYVGGAMACTHVHAPPSKRISPMFASAVHKCTLNLPILSEGRLPYDAACELIERPGVFSAERTTTGLIHLYGKTDRIAALHARKPGQSHLWLSKRRYDRRPVEKAVHRFRGQPARNQRVIPRCERQALTSGMQTSAAALHRKAKEFSARRLGPGCRWDRRRVTATRRCGRNGGVDRRLLVWRQCVRPTAVRQDA